MCYVCGLPNYVRCNCQSAQPFCDQCSSDNACIDVMDSQCVIYHLTVPGITPPVTRLINLNLPNGSSAQTIFEAIDAALGFSKPWTTGNTPTLDLTTSGPGLPIVLTGNVNVSAASGNNIIINPDGLYVGPAPYSGLVRVDPTSPLRYLGDAVVGGTDGCVNIDVDDLSGLLTIQPSLDIACLVAKICASEQSVIQEFVACLLTNGLTTVDTDTIDMDLSNSPLQLSADVKVSASPGNGIIINSDGLYASSSTPFTINNNTAGNVIVANGTSSSADGQPTLTYLNGMFDAPTFNYTMLVTSGQLFARGSFSANLELTQANYGVKSSNISGGYDSLEITSTVNNTFGRGHFIGGLIGEVVPNNNTATTITGLLSAVIAKTSIFGNNNYTQIASLRTSYPGTDVVLSGLYTGTITNYYALFIGDTNGDEGGINHANVTNSYAIFQEGSSLLNSFATAVVVTSDERVKTNIEDYSTGLDVIEKLNVVKYNFIDNIDSQKKIGLLAQQVESVIPEAVHTEYNQYYDIEDFKKLDTDTLVYSLINAVKELSAQNKNLNERLKVLGA